MGAQVAELTNTQLHRLFSLHAEAQTLAGETGDSRLLQAADWLFDVLVQQAPTVAATRGAPAVGAGRVREGSVPLYPDKPGDLSQAAQPSVADLVCGLLRQPDPCAALARAVTEGGLVGWAPPRGQAWLVCLDAADGSLVIGTRKLAQIGTGGGWPLVVTIKREHHEPLTALFRYVPPLRSAPARRAPAAAPPPHDAHCQCYGRGWLHAAICHEGDAAGPGAHPACSRMPCTPDAPNIGNVFNIANLLKLMKQDERGGSSAHCVETSSPDCVTPVPAPQSAPSDNTDGEQPTFAAGESCPDCVAALPPTQSALPSWDERYNDPAYFTLSPAIRMMVEAQAAGDLPTASVPTDPSAADAGVAAQESCQ